MRKDFISMGLFLFVFASECFANKITDDFNRNWQFTLSDSACYSFINYKTDSWRNVNLPHDWSIEFGFDKSAEACTAYHRGGIGWYSKDFKTPDKMHSKKCFIVFDGVYNNSEYWINGKKLGFHPYGYSPFFYDVTDYLEPDSGDNRLSVRVDHSRFADSRWYTGSGIYREVQMIVTDKLYIPVWGTFITTPYVSSEKAEINIEIRVKNEYDTERDGELVTTFYNTGNEIVGYTKSPLSVGAGEEIKLNQNFTVIKPELWDIESPRMYYAKTDIYLDGNIVGSRTTPFGIRSIWFDADKGFFLNGRNIKIKGVCIHHDASAVGAAFIEDVWRRRLQNLKSCGCNAIRISHNPAADALLRLCDELGFLVQEEFFDEWDYPKDKRLNMNERSVDYITRGYCEHFQEWAERDLKNVMLRSRNHPCIFQWSIGNEIEWTYKGSKEATGFWNANSNGNYFWNQPPYSPNKIREEWYKQPKQTYDIGRTARKLAKWTKEMDTTRPVVANCILPSVSYESGYIDALDVVGFSYRRVMYDYAKKYYPNKPVMGTENVGQWHEWKAVMERDFVSGMFIWTSVDYLGEVGTKGREWPQRGKGNGLLDFAGFEKPSFDMMKSLWTDEPFIALYSLNSDRSSYSYKDGKFTDKNKSWQKRSWFWENMNKHWNYNIGDSVIVEAYSNCDEIELFQNGKSLGIRYLKDFEDHIYKWLVNFKDGNIVAKGIKDGKIVVSSVSTTSSPVKIRLSVDKTVIQANGKDVVHVVAQLVDKKGKEVSWKDELVEFDIEGDYKFLGVDNGNYMDVIDYHSMKVPTYKGKALLILQSTDKTSKLNISAKSPNMSSNTLEIKIEN